MARTAGEGERTAWDSVMHPGGNLVIQKCIYDPARKLAVFSVEATVVRPGQPGRDLGDPEDSPRAFIYATRQ